MYAGVQPDPWAVTRLKARLRTEAKPSFDEIVGFVFRRYVLVASIVLLALTIALEITAPVADDADDFLTTWWYGDVTPDSLTADVPEYLLLTEVMDQK